MYLRCFTGDRPRHWVRWLPWAEYVYNTAYQSSLRDTPFRVVYDRDPPPSGLTNRVRHVWPPSLGTWRTERSS